MKQKLRLWDNYVCKISLLQFVNRLATSKLIYKRKQIQSDGHWPLTRLGLASDLDVTSELSRCVLDAPEYEQGALKVASRWLRVQSELRTQPEGSPGIIRHDSVPRYRRIIDKFCAGIARVPYTYFTPYKRWRIGGEYVANTWSICGKRVRDSEESCVWTHAMAPARSGLGLALGMLLLCLFAFHTGLYARPKIKQAIGLDSIAPLQIGDTIPEYLWKLPLQVVNQSEDKDAIMLKDYRGKLVILDFWATWCTSCIKAIKRNEPIGREFKDRVQFLPVTSQNKALLSKFFDDKEPFLSVHGDTLLSRLFPHKLVPHCVWIAPNGEVLAITSSSAVTRSGVQNALRNSILDFQKKEDLDLSRPLFLAGLPTTGAGLNRFEIMMQGSVSGLPSSSRSGIYQDSLRRLLLTNVSVKKAVRILMRLMLSGYDDKKLIYSNGAMEMEDSLQTTFSYDLITAAASGNLYSQALRRINELGPLTYRIMERPMECIVISAPEGHAFAPTEKGNDTVTTKRLINRLNALNRAGPLIIDETGKQYLPSMDLDSITSLKSALGLIRNQYRLNVRREQRNVEICLISIK